MEKEFERKKKHCIEGIHCKVGNCYYNNEQTGCTAHEISVGPDCAHCSEVFGEGGESALYLADRARLDGYAVCEKRRDDH